VQVDVVELATDADLSIASRPGLTRILAEAESLHVSPSLKTASLRAAFEGIDELDQTVSIAIDLVWSGGDHSERTSEHVTTRGSSGSFSTRPERSATRSPWEASRSTATT